jgi:hypothetical protein
VRNGLKKYYRIFICEKIKRETLEALVNKAEKLNSVSKGWE